MREASGRPAWGPSNAFWMGVQSTPRLQTGSQGAFGRNTGFAYSPTPEHVYTSRMGLERFPFTSYDFWAYLASGFLLLGAGDFVAGTGFLAQKEWSWFHIGVAVTCSYVAGQLVASMSSTVFERGLVRLLGYPRNVLFGQAKPWRILKFLLGTYYNELPAETQRAALDKGKVVGVQNPNEALFWPAFNACRDRAPVMGRLENFLNQYGFARNIALVSLVDAALLGWSYNLGGGPALHGNLALVALVAGVGMTLRYLKFFRLYAVEVFTAYAYAKEP